MSPPHQSFVGYVQAVLQWHRADIYQSIAQVLAYVQSRYRYLAKVL